MPFQKGNIPKNKGKKLSQELISRRILARAGYVHSKETKRKIGLGNKGKVITEEMRIKLSQSLKGRIAWNKGLTKEDPRVAKYLIKTRMFKKNDSRLLGENNPNFLGGQHASMWKGGRHKLKTGYIMLTKNKKNIKEHRYIMQEYLGRKLEINEDVHHIDGDKENNNIQNLLVLSKSEHTKLHWREGKRLPVSI